MADVTTDPFLARGKNPNRSENHRADLEGTTNALQHQLASWMCPRCRHHYSRVAAAGVHWQCEDCNIPLLDAGGEKAA